MARDNGGLARALNNSRMAKIPRAMPLKVATTQLQQRVINNSRFQVGGVKGKTQVDDMPQAYIHSFKNGGMVKKTGIYKLHKGEKVVSKSQLNKHADKMFFGQRSSK